MSTPDEYVYRDPVVLCVVCMHFILQAQLEEMKQKEESARKQVTENSRKECRDLQAENKLLSEQVTKLNGLNDDNIALLNEVKAQARKLEQEKEALQNEVQSAKTEVCISPVRSFDFYMSCR